MYNLDIVKNEYPQHQEVILYYKTTPCPALKDFADGASPSAKLCFQANCYHYHRFDEMRRSVLDEETDSLLYDRIPCPSFSMGYQCMEESRCRYSHTQNELNYHPLYYKTEQCTNCAHPNNPKACPRYHEDEVNRKSFVDGLIIMASTNESSINGDGARLKQGQFSLDLFKVKPCVKKSNHNVKICDYYHHDKDRRRPTNIFTYIPPICPYITRNANCPNGDNCRYAHNKLEQLYHPERYKRKFCLHHPHNIHKCDYGGHCSFAHNESEIKIELLHNFKQDEFFYLNKYKTVFCPYIYEHDRNQCVYAHNPQDLRRDPNQHKYNAIQCPYWSQGQIFSYDEGGCPNQTDCQNCHGWKELEYHPLYYKTKPCNSGRKCTKKDCPFYHTNSEKRPNKVTSQLTQSLFSLKNSSPSSLMKTRMFNPDSSPFYDGSEVPNANEKKAEHNPQRSLISMFMGFNLNENDPSRKMNNKICRLADSLPATNSFMPSTNYSDEEVLATSFKPRANTYEAQYLQNSIGAASANSDKGRFEQPRNVYSHPHDMWAPLHEEHEEKMDNYFMNITNSNSYKMNKQDLHRVEDSFDTPENGNTNEPEAASEKNGEISNDQFKKSFIKNLEAKGLSHTMPYLINPMIDLKALRSFTQKDFHLFPHLSFEDKQKIAKIIQEVLEEDTLFSEVNTITGDYPQNSYEDDDNLLFGCMVGSAERHQGGSPSLASKLARNSYN